MTLPPEPVGVALLGATGVVGQNIAQLLHGHPFLRLDEVMASESSSGRPYDHPLETAVEADSRLQLKPPGASLHSPVVLSALPGAAARELEPEYARRGHLVCSNASAFRDDPGVPLLVPEVNPESLQLLDSQGWSGALVTNPNCVVSGLSLALAPLHARFGIETVTLVTMQALSGAGRNGLSAWDTHANVIPHIEGEAEKIPHEIRKVLGGDFPVSVQVNRVAVLNGHLASVFVRLRGGPSLAEIAETLTDFTPTAAVGTLPTAPAKSLQVFSAKDRPQPRLDLEIGEGMTVGIGGLTSDPVYDAAFTVLSHNLVRGAAGACVLNAELALAAGWKPWDASALRAQVTATST